MKSKLFALLLFPSLVLGQQEVVYWSWYPGYTYEWELIEISTGYTVTDSIYSTNAVHQYGACIDRELMPIIFNIPHDGTWYLRVRLIQDDFLSPWVSTANPYHDRCSQTAKLFYFNESIKPPSPPTGLQTACAR